MSILCSIIEGVKNCGKNRAGLLQQVRSQQGDI